VKLIILAAAALAGGAPAAGPSAPDPSTPMGAANAFYGAYLQSTAGAFPAERARTRLRRLLSPNLNMLLEQAEHAEAVHAWRTHGQQPPLISGDVFTSLFEGAGRFQVQGCRADGMRAVCRIWLGGVGAGQGPARWQDQLMLVRAPRGWVVDDVVYGASWPSANRGRLSRLLRSAIEGG
jgi:hypothetical protein